VVEAISRSPFWEKTAIFIVEDDPQIGADHVEYHRSYCLVVSPWAKRGYISHVNASYPSLFRTFELVLGIPPMTRYDALATPLWDVFTTTPDTTPYTAIPRTVADEVNLESELGASHSARMDFSGPDRNPELGEVLWWYVKGAPRPGSALARELLEGDELEDAEEQAEERGERDLYEAHWAGLEAWLRQHPGVVHDIRRPPP
jgi:hypothetical protein